MTGEIYEQLTEFRAHMLRRGMTESTVVQRLRFAGYRLDEWGTWDVDGAFVGAWLNGFTGWTKSTYYAHLKGLFGWLLDAGRIAADPLALIPQPPRPKPRPKPLTEIELRRALETAPPDVRAWLMLGYLAGLRRFEIAKFRGEDITEVSVTVDGKGGQLWTVPTHPVLWELAQTYPRTGYWFPSPFRHERPDEPIRAGTVGNKIGAHFRTLGLTGATHRARHTYGTRLLRGGANLRVVQELMRHTSLATTALYLGVDDDELTSAIRGLVA